MIQDEIIRLVIDPYILGLVALFFTESMYITDTFLCFSVQIGGRFYLGQYLPFEKRSRIRWSNELLTKRCKQSFWPRICTSLLYVCE